jgi:hypothetical protein
MMSSREEVLKIASFVGCSGAHRSTDGTWMPCSSAEELQRLSAEAEPEKKVVFSEIEYLRKNKKTKRKIRGSQFEKLKERGVAGILSTPGLGITSMQPGSSGALF